MGVKASRILQENILKFNLLFSYKEIDVCEEEELLVKVLLNLTLDPSVYMNDNLTLNINSIFTFMPEELLKKTVAFLQFTDIDLFPLTKTSDDHWLQQQKNVLPIYHTDRITEGAIAQMVTHFKWRYVIIYEILTNSPTPQLRVERLSERFGNVHIRYFAFHIKEMNRNGAKIERIFDELKADIHLKVVILVGNYVAPFMLKAREHGVDKFWVLFMNYRRRSSNIDFVVFSKSKMNTEVLNIPLYHNETICDEEYIQGIDDEDKQIRTRQHCKKTNTAIKPFHASSTINHFVKLERTLDDRILNSLALVMLKKDGLQMKRPHINQNTKEGDYFVLHTIDDLKLSPKLMDMGRDKTINNSINHRVPNCQVVIIQKKKMKKKNQGQFFRKQIDFHCTQCRSRYYKDGNGGCIPCPKDKIPFKNQSACYDSKLSKINYKIMYVLDGIGAFVCLFILAVYARNRQTPIVRSSHLFLSTAQVTCCLAMFISFPLFSTAAPSVWLCTTRQTMTSLLLVAAASIVVCKAEQLLTICTMKTLICNKKKRDLFVKQTLIFLFIMLTDCVVIVSAFPFPSEPQTKTVYRDINDNPYTLTFCPLGKMSAIQVIYCISILLLSIVQALRGHNKLPDAYNDGNAIITSSATSACCLLFLVIYSIQKDRQERDFLCIINISLSISLLTLLFSLYGMKIYVILFQPNKNTKCYVKTYTRSMDYAKAYMKKREDSANASQCKRRLVVQDSYSESHHSRNDFPA